MLDKKDLSLYTRVGSGVEGIVYDIGNNKVAKIFNKIDLDKMEKIYELKNLKINNLSSKYIIQKFNLNFQCDIR